MDSDGAVRQVQNQKQSTRIQDSTLQQAASFESKNDTCRGNVLDSHQKREVLPRCSYRRNLNELPSDAPIVLRGEKLSDEEENPPNVPVPNFFNANTHRLLAFSPEGGIQIGSSQQGYQTFTMSASGAPQAGATIVQYSPQPGGGTQQYYVPASKVVVKAATGDMSAYQIRSSSSSLPQGVVMASSPGSLHSPQQLAEEASRKRELRLMKNREAAKECRRRKREYVRCLETRLTMLEMQNKKLIDELEYLKEIYAGKSS